MWPQYMQVYARSGQLSGASRQNRNDLTAPDTALAVECTLAVMHVSAC